jgi:hypothetical protein
MVRYWVGPCCGDPSHLINYHTAGYLPKLGDAIVALRDAIRDALFVKKVQNFRVLCPNKMVGVGQRREEPSDEEAAKTAAMWGPDPVHPTGAAYRVIAESLETDAANPDARYTNPGRTDIQHKKPRYDPSLHREGWVSGCWQHLSDVTVAHQSIRPDDLVDRLLPGVIKPATGDVPTVDALPAAPPADPTGAAATANSTVEGEEASNSIPTDSRLIFYPYCNIMY